MHICSRRVVQIVVPVLVTIALALPAQAKTFSNARLKGSYSFLTNLWTGSVNTNEFAMLGVMAFDGVGNVTGSYTSDTGIAFQAGALGGTYTVDSNGAGTITLTTGSTAQFAIMLDSTAAGIAHGLQLLQTNDSNNEIVSGSAVLQSTTTETYSVASLRGKFVAHLNRWTADAKQLQGSIIEIYTFDGQGDFKEQHIVMYDGKIETGTSIGAYFVSPDGSGGWSLAPGFNIAFALNSVVGGHAKGLQLMVLSAGSNYVDAGNAVKQ